VGGLATAWRRGRRRRGRPSEAEAGDAPELPVTRVTVIRPGGLGDEEEAGRWLARMRESAERCDELIDEGLRILNRALHHHQVATQEPFGGGVPASGTISRRVGYGTGDELADGRWTDAIDVPPPPGPRARADALRPQERLAAALGRREPALASETLLLRARADLDGERGREAALQLRVGLEALLAEVGAEAPLEPVRGARELAEEQAAAQTADLAALEERRAMTGGAANEALRGELSEARAAEVEETLRLCERVLRRRRLLAQ
jgi:hypothetical protein